MTAVLHVDGDGDLWVFGSGQAWVWRRSAPEEGWRTATLTVREAAECAFGLFVEVPAPPDGAQPRPLGYVIACRDEAGDVAVHEFGPVYLSPDAIHDDPRITLGDNEFVAAVCAVES